MQRKSKIYKFLQNYPFRTRNTFQLLFGYIGESGINSSRSQNGEDFYRIASAMPGHTQTFE